MVRELDLEFSQELSTRQEQLEEAQEQLRRATRDLDETRQTVQDCRAQTLGLVEAQQRIKNLEQSLEEEIHKVRAQRGYSATTRYKEDKEIDMLFSVSPPTSPPLLPTVGPLPLQQPNHSKDEPNGDHHADFVKDFNGVREKNEKVEGDPSVDTNGTENNLEPTETSQKKDTNVRQSETTTGAAIADKEVQEKEEASIREREHRAEQGVVHWRARVLAYERNERELTEELSKSKKTSTEQEQACRKVISICCGIPLEQVDVMLSSLTKAAIEKDSTNLDMTRIKAIMATLRQQRVALAAKEPVETASTPTSASISVAASDSITGSTSVPTSTPESASSGPELKTVTMEEDTPTTML
ncbi:hypothetical protein BGW38_007373 [Lunasporangiospora selenospora]|uniref:Uncharacterized protein n=1 Tax=Lunasporangiospora selenospora TaxID=979761 RepID=A0A9P6KA88_9FUNG|nr:hypothetical protein BGW38_007373 [Lunasporangiospora selenospora]